MDFCSEPYSKPQELPPFAFAAFCALLSITQPEAKYNQGHGKALLRQRDMGKLRHSRDVSLFQGRLALPVSSGSACNPHALESCIVLSPSALT